MFIIFLFPLVFSILAAIMFVTGDYGLFAKSFFGLLTVAAVVLQFVPTFQEQVHFLIPLFMQMIVCGAYYFASQFE